ncbi:MAG: RagB/SusD family nutrient uptake outer membrane protein [Bacteroidales bacterium]|jgi:tetratricopeptide (TPR) repeat protein|nr:RagB/SusD family nutrient uptake outer membrane protein [Bacteroidales bacterium]
MKNKITNKVYNSVSILAVVFMVVGCSKFTDTTPKGESLLNKVEELELLLNYQSSFDNLARAFEPMYLVNDFTPMATDVLSVINDHESGKESALSILMTWDESADRSKVLNLGGNMYDAYYRIVGAIANPILYKVDNAIGDKNKANQIKAEALVLRAYMHYLAVNLYAKAYGAEGKTDHPGVPYVFAADIFDADILNNPPKKRTVKEVYDFILADVNAAIALDALPETPLRIRVGKAFAYAVKAKALMAMGEYEDAYEAASQSLAVNDVMLDHRANGNSFVRREFNAEDLFSIFVTLSGAVFTTDLLGSFAPNDMFYNYGEMEKNLPDPYKFDVAVGLTVSRVIGTTSWSHYWMAQPISYHIPNVMGLSTTDMWLTQAECMIRGEVAGDGMAILQKIRERRTIEGQIDPLPVNPIDALKLVTRHEKLATLHQFINLKRWNTEPAWETTLVRHLELSKDGFTAADAENQKLPQPKGEIVEKDYELSPASKLWVFPFPQQAVNNNPNLTPNV